MSGTKLRLAVALLADGLRVTMHNPGPGPVRVWRLDNSWGWGTLSFRVMDWHRHVCSVREGPVAFTLNAPMYEDVPAASDHVVDLVLKRPDWETDCDAATTATETLTVEAILEIPPSREADEYGVFVGIATSEPVSSHSPHRWLQAIAR